MRWMVPAALLAAGLLAGQPAAGQIDQARRPPDRGRGQEGRAEAPLVIEGTLEAAPGYPWVHVQLSSGGRVLRADPQAAGAGPEGELRSLGDLFQQGRGAPTSFTAVLDTGASGHVVSRATAARFGIEAAAGAVYHETGLHGETEMRISRPYALAISGSTGRPEDGPGRFHTVSPRAALLLNPREPHSAVLKLAMGEVNLIGMPAIHKLLVEIDPSPMVAAMRDAGGEHGERGRDDGRRGGGPLDGLEGFEELAGLASLAQRFADMSGGPAVRLHDPRNYPRGVDAEVALEYVNFARRRNPRDRGPRPDLHENPVIDGVRSGHGQRGFTGRWLLDTGAPASIISTDHAAALGLVDDRGRPVAEPDFQLQFGGVGGRLSMAPGFTIDMLHIPTEGGGALEYRRAHVIVHDIGVTLDDGRRMVLDGVLGTNLLLPSVGGLGQGPGGLPTTHAEGPFSRIWIDGPRKRLLLEMD